jgi:hypothetical protein
MPVVRALVIGMIVALATGCDPGMTIRQAVPQLKATPSGIIGIRVKTTHPFIGTKVYAPGVQVVNSSESPIVVVSVELVTQGGTFANKSGDLERSGREIPSGSTQPLDLLFDLAENVKRSFRQPAELRVRYRIGGKDQTVSASLIGDQLDASIP